MSHANIMMINSSREQIKVKKEVEETTSEAQDEEEGEIASDEDSPADGKNNIGAPKMPKVFGVKQFSIFPILRWQYLTSSIARNLVVILSLFLVSVLCLIFGNSPMILFLNAFSIVISITVAICCFRS